MRRVFVAGLFHETHTFLERTTSLAEFERREGAELLEATDDGSPLGSALAALRKKEIEIVAGVDFRTIPGGTVDDAVIETFWERFLRRWDPKVDAVFLVLHGAMVSASHRDVEGEILARIRQLGPVPVFGVYDLHANFSPAMAEGASALVAYRENPHTDAREAAIRAVDLLGRSLETGVVPVMVHRHAGLIWTPSATATADDPMRTLLRRARDIEASHESVLAVNVNAGFAFADTPETGVSFSAVCTDPKQAELLLDELVRLAQSLDPGPPKSVSAEDAIRGALARPIEGLTVLTEPSDNIGAGAPGDGTGLLRAMISHRLERAAACLCDPDAVSRLEEVPIGETVRLPLGGRGSRFDPGPLEIDVELVSRKDGKFVLEDSRSHLASIGGDVFDMGRCAVVKIGGILVLLTSRPTPPFDLSQWRSQGIDPEDLRFLAVKAAVAHRRAFAPIAAREFETDTPGPCRSDLRHYDYRHAQPPWENRATG